MNKHEFFEQLGRGLSGLPQEDIDERLTFYGEMIDDRVEDGLSEEEAVAEIGSPDEIASQIIAETPLSKLVKQKVKSKRKLKAWEIVLIAVGSPIWVPLLIAAVVIVFSLYITLWSLIISLWAVTVAFGVSAVACVASCPIFIARGYGWTGLASLGAGLLLAGLTVFLVFGSLAASKGVVKLTKRIILGIKSLFVKKEAQS